MSTNSKKYEIDVRIQKIIMNKQGEKDSNGEEIYFETEYYTKTNKNTPGSKKSRIHPYIFKKNIIQFGKKGFSLLEKPVEFNKGFSLKFSLFDSDLKTRKFGEIIKKITDLNSRAVTGFLGDMDSCILQLIGSGIYDTFKLLFGQISLFSIADKLTNLLLDNKDDIRGRFKFKVREENGFIVPIVDSKKYPASKIAITDIDKRSNDTDKWQEIETMITLTEVYGDNNALIRFYYKVVEPDDIKVNTNFFLFFDLINFKINNPRERMAGEIFFTLTLKDNFNGIIDYFCSKRFEDVHQGYIFPNLKRMRNDRILCFEKSNIQKGTSFDLIIQIFETDKKFETNATALFKLFKKYSGKLKYLKDKPKKWEWLFEQIKDKLIYSYETTLDIEYTTTPSGIENAYSKINDPKDWIVYQHNYATNAILSTQMFIRDNTQTLPSKVKNYKPMVFDNDFNIMVKKLM